jgi:hypothetical protein
MTAVIFPFPIVRWHGFTREQAEHAALINPDPSARYIGYQLQLQRDAMRRQGVAEDPIARELKFMESAVRRELLQASPSRVDA